LLASGGGSLDQRVRALRFNRCAVGDVERHFFGNRIEIGRRRLLSKKIGRWQRECAYEQRRQNLPSHLLPPELLSQIEHRVRAQDAY